MKIKEYKLVQDKNLHSKLKEVQSFEYDGKVERSFQFVVKMFCTLYSLDKCVDEYVYALALNANGEWLGIANIAHGGQSEASVDCKTLFSFLLLSGASKFIVLHNHPSGILRVSDSDYEITETIEDGAKLLDLNMIEHIVISKKGYSLINEYKKYGNDNVLPFIDF